ncbi:MAG: DUF3820 family protein [Simkaniaceae bacterium]|nr:DUF3820 family protein [Simkaniaceae bacterium]
MRPIYYDTETTGIRPDKDRIIEIALFDKERDKTLSMLIDPEMPIPLESSQITGITDEMVAGKPKFKEAAEQMVEFCEGDSVLIAHNNDNFDKKFLEAEFARAGVELPEYKYIDTLKWARKYRPDLPRHALQYLRQVYGLEENNAHRALDDVIIMSQLFTMMIDDLPMEMVYKLLNEKGKKMRQMPFGKHRGVPLEKVPPTYLAWLAKSGALDKPENDDLKTTLSELGLLKSVQTTPS